MYQKKLLEAYKNAKNYTQDKQIAHDLELTRQRITDFKKSLRYLTDKEVIFLAKGAGIDPEIALIACHAERNENPEVKTVWEEMAKKFNSVEFAKLSMVCGSFVALLGAMDTGMSNYALRILC